MATPWRCADDPPPAELPALAGHGSDHALCAGYRRLQHHATPGRPYLSGPVRKGRVFLAWYGAVGGDTQHTEHGHYHAHSALVIQQAAGHQRVATVAASTRSEYRRVGR